MHTFSAHIINWQLKYGRHGLPWQGEDAYRVWLSEVMLQQTQVTTVIPYYLRFVARFPDVPTLAMATEEEVLVYWSGLGYYSRARNLLRAAQIINLQHNGIFPQYFDDIIALPGVGRSTAAAISALAFRQRQAILDGNVKRVLARYFAVEGYTSDKKVENFLWEMAEALLPNPSSLLTQESDEENLSADSIATYTQGLMDLGSQVCIRGKPECASCPLQSDCAAYKLGLVTQLPTPRPRLVLPEKRCIFLLLINGSDIFMERRASSGIWGGLWCPPQLEEKIDIAAYCAQQLEISEIHPVELPEFLHTFTHFKLHILPVIVRVTQKPNLIQEEGKAWWNIDLALSGAIPTPVRNLLNLFKVAGN